MSFKMNARPGNVSFHTCTTGKCPFSYMHNREMSFFLHARLGNVLDCREIYYLGTFPGPVCIHEGHFPVMHVMPFLLEIYAPSWILDHIFTDWEMSWPGNVSTGKCPDRETSNREMTDREMSRPGNVRPENVRPVNVDREMSRNREKVPYLQRDYLEAS